MELTFLPLDSIPDVGDLVWCRWPQKADKGRPGPTVRVVLVRATSVYELQTTGERVGVLDVSYGTGVDADEASDVDLVIRPMSKARQRGLHKCTRFSSDPRNRKGLLWCSEYFVPQSYVVNRGVVAGSLTDEDKAEMKRCLVNRGLPPS